MFATGNTNSYPVATAPLWGYPSFVIAVDNIREAMTNVANASGTIHGEPMEIPGIEEFVAFNDGEGGIGQVFFSRCRGGEGQGMRSSRDYVQFLQTVYKHGV